MSTEERHSARQSVETGTPGSFDSPSYAASSLRSYDSYSTTGKFIVGLKFFHIFKPQRVDFWTFVFK